MKDEIDIAEWRQKMRSHSAERITSIFNLAELPLIQKWELANQYWPDSPRYDYAREPWWLLQTEIGLIRFGRRKRVYEIDWSACKVRGIVTADDVTKEPTLVHAWTIEKAIEYLRELKRLAAQ